METIIEPERILSVKGDKLLTNIDTQMFQGCIGNKLVVEKRVMINIETLFRPNFSGGAFYPRLRKQLNQAKIYTNHAHNKPNKLIEIKGAVAIWPEREKIMADVYADARRSYNDEQ